MNFNPIFERNPSPDDDEPDFRPPKHLPTEILPGLYLGDYDNATDTTWLMKHNVLHILNISGTGYHPQWEKLFIKDVPLVYSLQIWDTSDQKISPYFDECIKFIDKGLLHGSVLVHCQLGISRSPSIIIAYLLEKKFLIGYHEALSYVKERRRMVSVNDGFRRQLIQYYNSTYYFQKLKDISFLEN